MAKTLELMSKITAQSPRAIAGIVRCGCFLQGRCRRIPFEIEEFGRCFGTDDFKEGVSAFLENGKPISCVPDLEFT